MSGTSSADPAKLSSYSTSGLEMVATLRSKATAVANALGTLRSSGSSHVPNVGDVDAAFTDLVGDWHHLDDFVSDVAGGFREADSGSGVVTVSDVEIMREGRVGFADRDEAIEAAAEAERQLDALLRRNPHDLSEADLQRVFALIERGQYDPAFAVRLSEGLGVEGYVDAMGVIDQHFSQTNAQIPAAGIAMATVLGTTLNTALGTVYQDEEDYDDPALADLAGEDRLDYGFIEDLATGFDPNEYPGDGGPADPSEIWVRDLSTGADAGRNLSVLLSFTNPPDWVAVDIANGRLSPYMDQYGPDVPIDNRNYVWGDRGGVITNYATMLSRNSDASTMWLSQHVDGLEQSNLDLALERDGSSLLDDGQALAQIVENGLTNDNVHESVPGAPSYVEGRPMRETLMDRAIDYIGEHNEINNSYLHDALASGVEQNMNVIDERINGNWDDGGGLDQDGMSDRVLNTHDFLREVMGDEDAMRRVATRLDTYIHDEMLNLSSDPAERQQALEENGRLLGVFTQAEANAILEAGEGEQAERLRNAGMVDSVVGLVPGYGPVPAPGYINSVSDILFDKSAGDILYPGQGPIDEAQQQRADIFDEARLNTWGYIAIEGIDSGAYDPADVLAAAGATPGGEGDFLTGSPGDAHRTVKPIDDMTPAQRQAMANWLFPDETEGGPFDYGTQARSDRNDLSAGLTDTALSELMDRTEN
jgi:hypothetical protein